MLCSVIEHGYDAISFSNCTKELGLRLVLLYCCLKTQWRHNHALLLNNARLPMFWLFNRSGLWRHIIGTCRRLRWLCRKHSSIVARHDKTLVKSTFLSRDTISRRSDIMLWLLYIKKLQYMHFQFWVLLQGCETAWSILFYHKNDDISLVKVHREYSPAARIIHTKFD